MLLDCSLRDDGCYLLSCRRCISYPMWSSPTGTMVGAGPVEEAQGVGWGADGATGRQGGGPGKGVGGKGSIEGAEKEAHAVPMRTRG